MRVLVTGGAGFIGSHLVDALVQRKDRVRVLDNLSSGLLRNLRGVARQVEFIKGDIRNEKVVKRALRGVEVVYHQAALRSVPNSVDKPLEYHEVNATATLNLFLYAREAKVRRVVYASSSSVYGDNTPLPQREDMPASPQSPYAASKFASEIYAAMLTRLHGFDTVGLRYFNVFGPRQSLENKYAVVIPKFITCLLDGKHPPIYGNGKQSRDFTYVKDVVQANLRAASAPRASGQVFNIANGDRHTVLELAKVLNKQIGVDIRPAFLSPRPGDVMHTWADISKAKKILGFRPVCGFVDGLARTVDWFSSHREVWSRC